MHPLNRAQYQKIGSPAKVIPVFKSGDNLIPNNYRPISLISTCCKLLEHIIANHICNHLEANNFFVDFQRGFRRKFSTSTHLLSIVHDFASAIDDCLQIDAIFLDLSKAFDHVPHANLIEILNSLGLPENIVHWI